LEHTTWLFICSTNNLMTEKMLSNSLKVHRAMKDLTQEELAEMVSVTRKTINTIENRKFIPSTYLALKLAQVLDTSVEELFQIEP
jgi:putative transcriptional regulator